MLSIAMPRDVKKAEPTASTVKRLCRKQIANARGWVSQGNRPKAVHGMRKEIKRLRAAIQLVRQDVARKDYHRVNRGLRATARSLAASRDARVMLKAFEDLTGSGADRFAGLRKELRRQNRRESRRIRESDVVENADEKLRRAKRRIKRLELKADGWPAVEPGLRRSYQRGREAWQMAEGSPSPENFHEWRKRIKSLSCQLELLCPVWPARTSATLKHLEEMGGILGEAHDLAMLRNFASNHEPVWPEEVGALERLIAVRDRQLRAKSLKLGAQMFGDSPADFCRQVSKDWNAWRNAGKRFS